MEPKEISPEQAEALMRTVQDILAEIAEKVKAIMEKVGQAVRRFLTWAADLFGAWWRQMLRAADPNLYHLAFHHRKSRVRKKNLARLIRKLGVP